MKRGLKKFGAFLLTAVMTLAMNSTVFAAGDMTGEGGVIGEFANPDTATVQDTSVKLYKEITALNPETCVVNAPTITYTYTVTAGDADKEITDASSHHAQINGTNVNVTVKTKAGVGSPVITGTTATNSTTGNGVLEITPADKLDASQYGTANRFEVLVDFNAIDFTTAGSGAGVYRYEIAETCTTATKNAAGISEGSVANTLYMDVYVDGDGKIYGYVLFTENDDIDASPDKDSDAATAAGKTEGFVGSKADGVAYTADDSIADKYYTFNLDLKKVVANDAYASSTKHQFPFNVTLTNASVTADVLPIMTINDNTLATQTALTAGAIAGTWTPKIADGGKISYVGIPCGTTIAVYETNDVAGVTYNAAPTNADGTVVAKSIDTGVVSNTATINCGQTALSAATENHTESASKALTFTNTLLQISPTGFVVRFAPYMLVLMGGIFLIVLGVVLYKRTNREEA